MNEKINAALKELGLEEDQYGQYVLGFRNESGTIFRRVKLEMLNEFVTANEGLPKFGFENEITDMTRIVQGCDAIYSLKA